MKSKVQEKDLVIALRQQGASYKEILAKVRVSKSSVSAWLKDYPLTDEERRHLKKRIDANTTKGRLRAAAALTKNRIAREQRVFKDAQKEFREFLIDPLFLVGVALYWAEGTKRFNQFVFTNSDPDMMIIMLAWIERFFKKTRGADIRVRLYNHKPFAHNNFENYWSVTTRIPVGRFSRTVYKTTGLHVKKRPNYKGCLKISLSGVYYIRKMVYWQHMLVEYYRKNGTLD